MVLFTKIYGEQELEDSTNFCGDAITAAHFKHMQETECQEAARLAS